MLFHLFLFCLLFFLVLSSHLLPTFFCFCSDAEEGEEEEEEEANHIKDLRRMFHPSMNSVSIQVNFVLKVGKDHHRLGISCICGKDI